MKLNLYTDGWSRWNPWDAGIGVYIVSEDGLEIEKRYKYLGIKTNNESEYLATLYWVQRCIELWATQIDHFADSKLVIMQLSWGWKIKKDELRDIKLEIQQLLKSNCVNIIHTWIPREKNKEADRLSNVAMNNKI